VSHPLTSQTIIAAPCCGVLRVPVSNWSTDADDVAASVDAVRRAAAGA
jgi:hypothetical protein